MKVTTCDRIQEPCCEKAQATGKVHMEVLLVTATAGVPANSWYPPLDM